jgi:hypothetical protein
MRSHYSVTSIVKSSRSGSVWIFLCLSTISRERRIRKSSHFLVDRFSVSAPLLRAFAALPNWRGWPVSNSSDCWSRCCKKINRKHTKNSERKYFLSNRVFQKRLSLRYESEIEFSHMGQVLLKCGLNLILNANSSWLKVILELCAGASRFVVFESS